MSTSAALPLQVRPARSGIPRGFAALIGLLAVGGALGFGQLLAALLSPVSSPFLAVGNTVINYSPEPLTEFAKVHLGTDDKPILLSGMAVVIALGAVVAGQLSRSRVGPGVTVVAALGVAGLLAVVLSPVFSPVDLVAPVVSLLVGLLVFAGLHRLAARAYDRTPAAAAPANDVAASDVAATEGGLSSAAQTADDQPPGKTGNVPVVAAVQRQTAQTGVADRADRRTSPERPPRTRRNRTRAREHRTDQPRTRPVQPAASPKQPSPQPAPNRTHHRVVHDR